MDTRTKIIIAAVALIGAFGAGWYLTPTKVVTKTEIKEVIKEVVKEKESTTKDKKNDKVVIVVETVYPDGRRVKETKIVDKGSVTVNIDKDKSSETDKSTETKTEKTVERAAPSLAVSVLAAKDVTNLSAPPAFGASVTKRILGPFTVGGFGLSNGTAGVSVGVLF